MKKLEDFTVQEISETCMGIELGKTGWCISGEYKPNMPNSIQLTHEKLDSTGCLRIQDIVKNISYSGNGTIELLEKILNNIVSENRVSVKVKTRFELIED